MLDETSLPFTSPLLTALEEGSPSPPVFVISKENRLLQQEVRNFSGLLNLLPNRMRRAFNNHHL